MCFWSDSLTFVYIKYWETKTHKAGALANSLSAPSEFTSTGGAEWLSTQRAAVKHLDDSGGAALTQTPVATRQSDSGVSFHAHHTHHPTVAICGQNRKISLSSICVVGLFFAVLSAPAQVWMTVISMSPIPLAVKAIPLKWLTAVILSEQSSIVFLSVAISLSPFLLTWVINYQQSVWGGLHVLSFTFLRVSFICWLLGA